MKNEKDIIEEIVSRLRRQVDMPYRDGAWERFQTQYADKERRSRRLLYWSSVAAALLLLAVGGWYVSDRQSATNPIAYVEQNDGTSLRSNVVPDIKSDRGIVLKNEDGAKSMSTPEIYAKTDVIKSDAKIYSIPLAVVDADAIAQLSNTPAQLDYIELPQLLPNPPVFSDQQVEIPQANTNRIHTLASSAMEIALLQGKDVTAGLQNKSFGIGGRLELGLFVSPYATSQNMNLGGGFVLGYDITPKLSIRTGASYNTYLVNELKNPAEAVVEVPAVAMESAMARVEASGESLYQHKLLIPNINAMTGVVKSLDVPLELKYNITKTFYAASGIAYSTILNQERNAHYIENVNTETFAKGFPENEREVASVVKAVTKEAKTDEDNVNPNGFSGFVNFSIGKRINIGNRFGVSVEPYLKVPLGQYRLTDMNYTNGGLRIMTNF